MNSKETIPVETGEAPVDKDLVKKEEKRKAELKRLASEEYGARWEQIQEMLDTADASFGEVNYSDRQMEGLTADAFAKISKALEGGDVTVAQETLADLKKDQEDFRLRRNMHPSRVESVMINVQDFLDQFDLKKYVILKNGMRPEEIKRAINLGYEAKMWELTNRLED